MWQGSGKWDVRGSTVLYFFKRDDEALLFFLHPTFWNIDVMASTPVAILFDEDEAPHSTDIGIKDHRR